MCASTITRRIAAGCARARASPGGFRKSRPLAQHHDGAVDFDEATANDDDLLDAWIHNTCTSMAHPTCTCAMGQDPAEGAVVDSEGQVFGVAGLRVADASIMPTLIRANTNFTSMVIGERIAEWMADD